MNNDLFTVRFVTPVKAYEREVRALRLRDKSGAFGIMKGHADFMTALSPGLGFYRDRDNKEIYLAVNGGLLLVMSKQVTLLSREITESGDINRLSSLFKEEIEKGSEYERSFREMIRGIEKVFREKNIEAGR